MSVALQYNLDLDKKSVWNMVSATAASKSSLLYLQESGVFLCGPNYFTEREGFSSFLIKLTVSGQGLLEYQGQQYQLPPGSFFWIDCRKPQCYRTDPAVGSWHTVWVHFYGAGAQFYYDTFLMQNSGSVVATVPGNSPVTALMGAILAQDNSGCNQQKTDFESASLLTQLITECTLCSMAARYPEDIPQTILAIRQFLNQNYTQKITLAQLGELFNLNPYYLQKQFKRNVGQTPSEYIIYLRMTRAKAMMRQTQKSISQIAREVGIQNLGYFTRQFKQQEGLTPQEYCKLWPIIEKDDPITEETSP